MTDVFGWLRKVWPNVNRIKKYMKITAAKLLHGVIIKKNCVYYNSGRPLVGN